MNHPESWKTHVTRQIQTLQAGLLDLIDCGLPEPDQVVLRTATDNEKAQTTNETARPAGPRGRTSETPDPVAAETGRWADELAAAIVRLQQLVDDWHQTVRVHLHARNRHVTDHRGRTLHPPPPGDLQSRGTRTLAKVPPSRLRQAVLIRTFWLTAAADAIADAWTADRNDGHDVGIFHDRAGGLEHDLHAAARRYGRTDTTNRPTRCVNPYGLTNHPLGKRPIGGLCRSCWTGPCRGGCGRLLKARDAEDGHSTCEACRKASSRRRTA